MEEQDGILPHEISLLPLKTKLKFELRYPEDQLKFACPPQIQLLKPVELLMTN